MKSLLTLILIFSLGAPYAMAGKEVNRYKVPDVKDDFCGIHINFQYCKCAFHDEFCDAVGLKPSSANRYVADEFREWNRDRIQAMGVQCLLGGGHWNKSNWSCTTCTEGDVREGTNCVAPEKADTAARECTEALKNIETNWEKYSDFDDRLGSDVSYEVQQFNTTLDEIAAMVARAQALEYEMEIDRQVRLSLREYKQALVQNIKANLLRAFWRLSYVTYTTAKGAQGTAESLGKLLNPENIIEGVGAGLKVIQANIPPGAKEYQFDTNTTAGKVKSVAWNATLETIESVGNPVDVAKKLAMDTRNAVLPNPNISDEEIEILRTQHMSNAAVDAVLAENYAVNAGRRAELAELEAQITEKYNELQEWKAKEYRRVKANLEDQCKDTK